VVTLRKKIALRAQEDWWILEEWCERVNPGKDGHREIPKPKEQLKTGKYFPVSWIKTKDVGK
jgi:hypothetical protein